MKAEIIIYSEMNISLSLSVTNDCSDNSQSGSTAHCRLCFEVRRALKNANFMGDFSAGDCSLSTRKFHTIGLRSGTSSAGDNTRARGEASSVVSQFQVHFEFPNLKNARAIYCIYTLF
jgi:hypothetical protein